MGEASKLHELLADRYDEDEFRAEVAEVREAFHGLLDEEACAMYVVAREGRLEPRAEDEIVPGHEVTLEATVERVRDLRTFQRSNGSTGKVLNVHLSTEDGSPKLVLWDEDAETYADLAAGERVRIEDGLVKDGRYGLEIHPGDTGHLERLGRPPERGRAGRPGRPSRDLTGELTRREPTRTFVRDDGETGFVTTVVVEDDEPREVTVWNGSVRDIQAVPIGGRVELTGLVERGDELHSTGRTEVRPLDPDATTSLDAFGDP